MWAMSNVYNMASVQAKINHTFAFLSILNRIWKRQVCQECEAPSLLYTSMQKTTFGMSKVGINDPTELAQSWVWQGVVWLSQNLKT